jgi:serine/threonine protein phosphatase PrpC
MENETAIVAHVGDTRLYKIQNEEINKLTTDHSPVGELEEGGDLSEIGLMRHPRRNEVSRCLGLAKLDFSGEGFVDTFRVSLEPEAAFLICSDGLSDLLSSNKILEIILDRAQSPEAVVRGLIDEANGAGGKDNITVVFVAGRKFSGAVEKWRENQIINLRKNSLKNRISLIIFSRWAFFIYGILLGAALLFWYFYRFIPINLEVSAP